MKRENDFDLLRIISCIMVISIHVSAIYVGKYLENPNINFTIGNFFDSFTRLAVPIFVLLSGRFALSDEKNINAKGYYKKFYKRIIIPTAIWSILYFIYGYAIRIVYFFMYGELKEIYAPIKSFIAGAPFYHLWYLYMSIGLYLLVPFLIKLKKRIGEDKFFKLGVIFFVLGMLIYLFETYLEYIKFYDREDILKYFKYIWKFNQLKFINYLGYFMLGYSLKNLKYKFINFKNMMILTSVSLFSMFLATEYTVRNKILTSTYFYSNNFIFVMIGAVSIYLAFENLRLENSKYDFSILAGHTFNIYLVHAGILSVISIFLDKIIKYEPNPLWYIPFMICFIFTTSYLFAIILEKVKIKFITMKNKL